jgi:hypothetical protein
MGGVRCAGLGVFDAPETGAAAFNASFGNWARRAGAVAEILSFSFMQTVCASGGLALLLIASGG